jgi:hypothetical protein
MNDFEYFGWLVGEQLFKSWEKKKKKRRKVNDLDL